MIGRGDAGEWWVYVYAFEANAPMLGYGTGLPVRTRLNAGLSGEDAAELPGRGFSLTGTCSIASVQRPDGRKPVRIAARRAWR